MTKGQRIKTKREELNISQTELANQIGVSKQTLYKYENDLITNIPSDVIERMSFRLGCDPAYIMGWEVSKEVDPRDMDKAWELYQRYINLPPEFRKAADALLKIDQADT